MKHIKLKYLYVVAAYKNRHQRKLFNVHDSMLKEISGGGRSVRNFLGLTHFILVLRTREIMKVNEVRAIF